MHTATHVRLHVNPAADSEHVPPAVYLLQWLLKLSAAWHQDEWGENCAQIDPLFVQSSSKYRPEVARHECSEIWREGGRKAGKQGMRGEQSSRSQHGSYADVMHEDGQDVQHKV